MIVAALLGGLGGGSAVMERSVTPNERVELARAELTDHGFYTGGMTDAEITDRALNLALCDVARELNISVPPDADTAALSNAVNQRIAQMRNENAASTQETAEYGKLAADMTENERYEALKNAMVQVVSEDGKTSAYSNELAGLESIKAKARSTAEKIIFPLARKLGILNRSMTAPQLDIEFQFSKNGGLAESTQKQLRYGGSYADFAKALIHLDEIIQNAVLIEKHGDKYKGTARENRNLIDTSVLLGLFQDGKQLIPVQMEIKNTGNDNRLYMIVAMTKVEAGVFGSPVNTKGQASSLIPASAYSIADVFANVNPTDAHFLKYVPDQFLSDAQKEAKRAALAEDVERIGNIPKKQSGEPRQPTPAEQAFLDGLAGKEFNVLPPGLDYERWSKALGFYDAAKTVAEFNSLRYTDPDRFALLQVYIGDVESGKVSPNLGFKAYELATGDYYPGKSGSLGTDTTNGDKLPSYTSRGIELPDRLNGYLNDLSSQRYVAGSPGEFSLWDISILSRETDTEYAVVTVNGKSYLIRGEEKAATLPKELVAEIIAHHGTLDHHSHPFANDVIPSKADIEMIKLFPWQENSVIVDESNNTCIFNQWGIVEVSYAGRTDMHDITQKMYESFFGGD